jgi:hypothetical protein
VGTFLRLLYSEYLWIIERVALKGPSEPLVDGQSVIFVCKINPLDAAIVRLASEALQVIFIKAEPQKIYTRGAA